MNLIQILSSEIGLYIWTTGVIGALCTATVLSVYLLPWRDDELLKTHLKLMASLNAKSNVKPLMTLRAQPSK